jgi:hypothetical protein
MRRATPQLKQGDYVELIHPIAGLAPGTRGTILRRFTFDPLYDIFFDGYPWPRLVSPRFLAPASREDRAVDRPPVMLP